MGMLDGLLGQVADNVDVKNLAEKVGLPPELAEKAIAALGEAHAQPGDTVATAAQNTGVAPDVLQQIVAHIGGEGSLAQFAALIQGNAGATGLAGMLDRDGDGNPLNDLAGLAGGFLKR